MAHIESYDSIFTLDEDQLSTFLSDTSDAWAIDPTPVNPPTLITSRNQTKQVRRSRRAAIQHTRLEIAELEHQIQVLQERHAICESVGATESPDWSELLSRARLLIKMAHEESAGLRKRVDANVELTQRISMLMRRLMETMPKLTQIDHRIVKITNKGQVYRVLRACLDIRSKSELGPAAGFLHTGSQVALEPEIHRWNTVSLEASGVGVDYYDSVVLPFSPSFIADTVARHSSLSMLEISNSKSSKPIVSDQRLVVRRLVKKTDCSMLLWEDASCWQQDTNSLPISVRGSGWAFATPVSDHGDELSIVHSGGVFQIYTADGSRLEPTDALVGDIVTYKQSLQQSRVAILEHILICSRSKFK